MERLGRSLISGPHRHLSNDLHSKLNSMAKLISIGPISTPAEPLVKAPIGNERRPRQAGLAEPARILFERLGFQENPFGFTPDPRYLYQSRSHGEARASLIVGLECGLGFHALIGQPGMGKTTLLFDVLERFNRVAHTALLFQLQGDARDFLRYVATELGSEVFDSDLVHLQEAINRLLVRQRELGRRTIIVIDEAQTLSTSVLEMIRLLSNFETPSEKLLQIVLAGQPQLAQKLTIPELSQLRQRISIIKTLVPLDLRETSSYIEHRLKVARYRGQQMFTPAALKCIWDASRGVPRDINTICFNALLLLAADGEKQVDPEIVREVIGDLQSFPSISDQLIPTPREQWPPKKSMCSAPAVKRDGANSTSYAQFYQFKRAPFEIFPEPSFLYLTSTHSGALAGLYSSVRQDQAAMSLIGGPGSGKSLMAACLAEMLACAKISSGNILGRDLHPGDTLNYQRSASQLSTGANASNPRQGSWSQQQPDLQRTPGQMVLLVDEAQGLSLDAWREIQLLAMLPVETRRVQFVLFGRPKIEETLQIDELRELRSRIGAHHYELRALDEVETGKYIAWRIGRALENPELAPIFNDEAVSTVHRYTRGVPRLINLLCEVALVRGHALRQRTISAAIVREAAERCSGEVEIEKKAPRTIQSQPSEVLKAATVLLEFHTELHGLGPEGRRRRCNGGKRSRDPTCNSEDALG
jgi:type II secretory pathway predicted ATPase ExeA